jgi:hypothetical protein
MSQAEPIFTRAEGLDLYWLEGGLSGFLASPDAGLGDSVALSASWADTGGVYLFLGAPTADGAALQAELRAWLANQPARMLWLAAPDAPVSQWQVQSLPLSQDRLSRRFDINYGGLILTVTGGAAVSLATAAQGWGFAFAATPAATLQAGGGALEATGPAVVTYATGQEGCWRFNLPLPATTPEAPAGLARLEASLRFFGDEPDGSIRVLNLRPLVQTTASTLWATLDPLRPLEPTRTHLDFFPPADSGETATPVAFDTDYATARGYAVSLTPQAATASLPPAGLVLAVQPQAVGAVGGVPVSVYPTPIGAFGMAVSLPVSARADIDFTPADRLLCGMSGLEYLGLAEVTGNSLVFTRPGPAYAPPALDEEAGGSAQTQSLLALGTTAWTTMTAADGVGYYAQPEEAALYSAGAGGFLNYLEVPAALLPAPTAETIGFPMAPYRGLAASEVELARRLEARAVAPARRKAIGIDTEDQLRALKAESGAVATTVGVTPQGLAVGLTSIDGPWAWMGIGRNATAPDSLPDVRFTQVHGEFRQALQTNRLFMVLGNTDAVMQNGSVAYKLTALSLGMIADLPPGKGVSPTVLSQVRAVVSRAGYPTYPDEGVFDAMLDSATGGAITAEERLVFQRYAGQLLVSIDKWRFQLSPRNWHNPDRAAAPDSQLIFKLVGGRSLVELLDDIPSWTWPEAASSAGPAAAQSSIRAIIRNAREAVLTAQATGAGATPYDNFIAMVDDPNWTGVLALSVDVPLDALPGPLQALAAGIDPSGFYAHHLGLTATPFEARDGQLVFQTTSSFGLIDYQDPVDQYFSEETAFAFKVLQLTVGFQNANLVSFASRVELMINRMFGAFTRLYPTGHGNNILLDGVYQSQRQRDGSVQGTYVFAMREQNSLQLSSGALKIVELLSAQLVTVKPANQASGDSTISAVFQLTGNLGFEDYEQFDPFSFGTPLGATLDLAAGARLPSYLRFSNLAISMTFSLAEASQISFAVADGNIHFDLANSLPRPNSLVARFPVRLTGLVTTPDPRIARQPATVLTPEAVGFASISAPIQQGKLSNPWYGLTYQVDMGGLGALAGNVGITVRLLAGWSPKDGDIAPGLFVGVALPGVKNGLGVDLPLQGILKLGFRTIQFVTHEDGSGPRNYLLRLRDFGIRILGLGFPPGHNDISLFGNPDQTSNTKLGWYAAYSKASDPSRKALGPLAIRRPSRATADREDSA